MSKQIVLETKLVGDISGEFYVPSYQRGYRWGTEEVKRLLNDVLQNGDKNYCLQPIVVRRREDDSFELIDGQQRLTTIYLIYKYLQTILPGICAGPDFSLIYETRDKSAEFLKDIDLDLREDNIDFWFISNAYEVIEKWFLEDPKHTRGIHMFQYLAEEVKVIWYEVGEEEDAISLFTRLNIGRIALTSAELVKAMFLSRDSDEYKDLSAEERERKQNEISLQWDNMEKELHNESLWYFLTNKTGKKYQTRIDLVLDLIAGKKPDNREAYYTFFELDRMRENSSLDNLWSKISQTFLILKDWFEDHELYHKIGYLVASDSMKLAEIYDLSEGKTKDDFRSSLDDLIKKSVKIDGDYSGLSYENKQDYESISRLLLLFNVESVRQNGEQTQWFPFDKYKFDIDSNKSWSLEHIHAQRSEGLTKQEDWKEWLRLHIPSIRNVSTESDDLVTAMEEAIDKKALRGEEFKELQDKVLDELSVEKNTDYLHTISNLALLNTSDNAALNNSTFDVKRDEIIKRDKRGEFIPFCTRMVFLKYYTPSEGNQLHFWGPADRNAYVKHMNVILKNYLSEPTALEKEE